VQKELERQYPSALKEKMSFGGKMERFEDMSSI
jgi:hypothetical protein